jgi:hypothetical protein
MTENLAEFWKDIPGYEGLYQVSNIGRVKSFITGKFIKPSISTPGYYRLNLYKNKKPKGFDVHRLVAISFLGEKRMYVNHKDLNKLNNNIENLEYTTNRQNSNHYHNSIGNKTPGIQKIGKMYQVRLRINGVKMYFGRYSSIENAIIKKDEILKTIEPLYKSNITV